MTSINTSTTVTVSAKVNPQIKDQAIKILDIIGIKMTKALQLLFNQLANQQQLPIQIDLNNQHRLLNEKSATLKSTSVTAKIDSDVRERAVQFLNQFGLTPSTIIQLFLMQLATSHQFPLNVKLTETQQAILDTEAGNTKSIGHTLKDVDYWIDSI